MEKPADHFFDYKLIVSPADIDAMGHANNVVYLRWVQEAAAAHWSKIASSHIHQRYAWVVLRHEIDYLSPAFAGDALIASTWIGKHHGATSERFVQVSNASTSKILANAKTIWCLLDAITLKAKRIDVNILEVFKSAT
jgi:acyl-CoA thioester hydrolase